MPNAYQTLIEAFPRLGTRYYPPLIYRERAAYVLANVSDDPLITPEEIAALRAFAGDKEPGPHYDYQYCTHCMNVVGLEEHWHCDECIRLAARRNHTQTHPEDTFPTRATYMQSRVPTEPLTEAPCEHCEHCSDHCDCTQCDNCEEWNDACDCASCGRCGARFDPQNGGCSDCSLCDRHANCIHCNDCSSECSDDYCSDCDMCTGCCDCDRDSTPECDYAPHVATDNMAFKCKRLVGVEWEYNFDQGFGKIRDWSRKWGGDIHHDGSCGMEAVTPPIAGDNIDACLGQLAEAFAGDHAEIDSRCGIHVHVDTTDYNWTDMRRLLLLYSHIEPALYALSGAWRAGNHYCGPCGAKYAIALKPAHHMSDDNKVSLTAVALNQTEHYAKLELAKGIHKKDGGRYKGLNVMPWLAARKTARKDTTVEFRLHENSKSGPRVIGWTKLCATIVEWVKTHEASDVGRVSKLGPVETLCDIAPESAEWIRATLKEVHRGRNLSYVTEGCTWVSGAVNQ